MKYLGENIMNITEIVGTFYDENKRIEYLLYYDNNELKTINRDEISNSDQLILKFKIKERRININNPIGISKANRGCYWIIYMTKNNDHYCIHNTKIPIMNLNNDIHDKLNTANSEWKYGEVKKIFQKQ